MASSAYKEKTEYEFNGAKKEPDAKEQVFSFFSRGWSSLTSTIKTVVEEPKIQEVLQKVKEQIDVIAKPEDDADSEQNKKLESVRAPWEDIDDNVEASTKDEVVKAILSIPQQRRNLLNGPPEIEGFEFDFDKWVAIAMVALKKDAELSNARFELVPKRISEKEFWRNYFSRVFMIKQAFKVTMHRPPAEEAPPAEQPSTSSDSSLTTSSQNQSSAAVAISTAPVASGESILKQTEEQSSSDLAHSPEFASELYLDNDLSIEELKMSLGDASLGDDSAAFDLGNTGSNDDNNGDELELGETLSLEEELQKELEKM